MMKSKMRMLPLLFIISLFCVLTLAGCGDDSSVNVVEDGDNQPEYLSFFSQQRFSDGEAEKYWSDYFTETYNKKVYINFEDAAYYDDEGLSYRELLEKRLESSSPDDLYIINAEDVLEFGEKGYWMDLSDMDFVDNLSESALYQSTYDDKVFSVPLIFTGFGFIWNVDILKEHGLTVPENLDEFWQVCSVLKSQGLLPYGANKGFALTVPAMCIGFSDLYGGEDQEEKIADLNNGTTPVSTYMRDGYEFLQEMIDQGYMDPQQALNSTPSVDDMELFINEKCAFICATLDKAKSLEEMTFTTEMTGLPILEDGSIAVYGADLRLCVNPASQNLDLTLDFIEMVGTEEALAKTADLNNVMSSAKNSEPRDFPTEKKLVELLGQPGQIPNQDFALHFNTWESIRDVARELCAGATVDEACDMLDEKQKADLEVYGAVE